MTAACPNFPASVCEEIHACIVNGLSGVLQGSSLLSLRSVSSFSATPGTDLWESRVGKSATIPDLQGQSGNDALVNSISFSETRTRHTQPNKEDGDHYVFSGHKFPLLFLVGEQQRTKFTKVATCSSSFPKLAVMFCKGGLTSQRPPELYFVILLW